MCFSEEFILRLSNGQSVSSCIVLQIICYLTLPPILNLLFWYHLLMVITSIYVLPATEPMFYLTDHIGLPIIHIETYKHNRHKRQEHRCGITDYIILKRVHTKTKLNQVLIWLNSLMYMIYRQLHITTYQFGQPTRPYAANLISN